jgi:hypothetical protein
MITIQIPDARDEMVARLNDLGTLLTARGWERAAIVAAHTHQDGTRNTDSDRLSVAEFAALGIHGLTSSASVARHRRNWWEAVAAGNAESVSPGQTVTLPTTDYPIVSRAVDDEVARAKAQEEVFVERIGQDPSFFRRVERAYRANHPMSGITHMQELVGRTPSPLGVGRDIKSYVGYARRRLTELLTHLETRRDAADPTLDDAVTDELRALDEAVDLIRQYQREIRQTVGLSDDAFPLTDTRVKGAVV